MCNSSSLVWIVNFLEKNKTKQKKEKEKGSC